MSIGQFYEAVWGVVSFFSWFLLRASTPIWEIFLKWSFPCFFSVVFPPIRANSLIVRGFFIPIEYRPSTCWLSMWSWRAVNSRAISFSERIHVASPVEREFLGRLLPFQSFCWCRRNDNANYLGIAPGLLVDPHAKEYPTVGVKASLTSSQRRAANAKIRFAISFWLSR